MKRNTVWKLVTVLLLATVSAPAAGSNDGWPATRAGALARGWVAAFSSGEAAMKSFLARELAPKSLESKALPQRMARYRELREQYGKLELASVVKSTPAELSVRLMASDATLHEFVFTIEKQAPFKLVSVGIKQRGHFGGHGLFGH